MPAGVAPLVLSLFPGIGLLDMAFEQEGFCIVRGPDVLWGGDIHSFHPPASVFHGVIGGPPCQVFSRLAIMVRHNGYEPRFGNLIPEFERCVAEAEPAWFLMENVVAAPTPVVMGYDISHYRLNNRWFTSEADRLVGAKQNRIRAISWGVRPDGRDEAELMANCMLEFDVALFERQAMAGGVTAGHGGATSKQYVYGLEEACELQGLPRDFTADMPFRKDAKLEAVANGVPLPMGRAIARAVKRAMGYS